MSGNTMSFVFIIFGLLIVAYGLSDAPPTSTIRSYQHVTTPEAIRWNDTLLSRLDQQDCTSMFRCPPPLATKSKVMPDWDKLDCRCDDDCVRYGDCCANWNGFDPRQARQARRHFKCANFVAYRGIYLLSTCPANWTDDAVRTQCESADVGNGDAVGSTADPLLATPVTSLSSRFTYPNFHCAACNSDLDRIVYWTPRVECGTLHTYNVTYGNITSDYVWRHLRYDATDHVWGVQLPTDGGIDFGPFVRDPTFVPCRVVVQMPVNVVDTVRQCYPSIDECPSGWTGNDTVRSLCESYTAVVFSNVGDMPIFRNVHCAACHNESTVDLDCRSFPMYRNVVPSSFAPSFAFLFDINERSGTAVGTVDRCPPDQIYDPFFRYCRQMVCAGPRYVLSQGRCVADETTTIATVVTDKTTAGFENFSEPTGSTSSEIPVTTELSGTTASTSRRPTTVPMTDNDCPRFNISNSDYKMYGNGTVYIARYNRHYAPGEYVSSLDGHILICSPLTDDDGDTDDLLLYRRKFSLAMSYLTVAGLGISLVCIFFHMVAFALVPCLRNLSGKNLASLCVVLSVAYVTFIVSQFQGANPISRRTCASIGVLLYYCFLATFFWMNSIAFDVWRTLRLATSELRVSAGQQWRKFILYSAYSWLSPAIIVAISIVVENSSSVPAIYRPAFGQVTCWFASRRALLVFFVAPIAVLLALNVIMFVLSAHIIIRSTLSTSGKLHPGSQQQARRNFSLYLRLALIMGLTWLFGVAAGQLDTVEPLWYAFVVLNTLQGLFIFLSFTCTEKVRNYLRDKVFCRGSSYYGSSTQVTNTRSNQGTRKFELEGRDSAGSGSGESQSSSASRSSLIKLNSRASNVY